MLLSPLMALATSLFRRTACALSAALLVLALLPAAPAAQEAQNALPAGPGDETVARITAAFSQSDAGVVLEEASSRVELVLLGQGTRYSRGQAALVLRDFFRRYPPANVVLSERSAAGDGRAAMGRYWSGASSAPFTLYLGFRVGGDVWTLEAIRIERAPFQRTGTY